MRLFKLLLISFVALFVLMLGISLFIPSHVRISRAIDITAGYGEVYKELKNTGEWKNWLFTSADSGITIRYAADSQSVRLNEDQIVIREILPDEVITGIISPGGKTITSGWKLMQLNQQDSVTVQWYMDFDLQWYPWEKFRSLLFDKIYGTRMEKGLAALKNYLENHSSQN